MPVLPSSRASRAAGSLPGAPFRGRGIGRRVVEARPVVDEKLGAGGSTRATVLRREQRRAAQRGRAPSPRSARRPSPRPRRRVAAACPRRGPAARGHGRRRRRNRRAGAGVMGDGRPRSERRLGARGEGSSDAAVDRRDVRPARGRCDLCERRGGRRRDPWRRTGDGVRAGNAPGLDGGDRAARGGRPLQRVGAAGLLRSPAVAAGAAAGLSAVRRRASARRPASEGR